MEQTLYSTMRTCIRRALFNTGNRVYQLELASYPQMSQVLRLSVVVENTLDRLFEGNGTPAMTEVLFNEFLAELLYNGITPIVGTINREMLRSGPDGQTARCKYSLSLRFDTVADLIRALDSPNMRVGLVGADDAVKLEIQPLSGHSSNSVEVRQLLVRVCNIFESYGIVLDTDRTESAEPENMGNIAPVGIRIPFDETPYATNISGDKVLPLGEVAEIDTNDVVKALRSNGVEMALPPELATKGGWFAVAALPTAQTLRITLYNDGVNYGDDLIKALESLGYGADMIVQSSEQQNWSNIAIISVDPTRIYTLESGLRKTLAETFKLKEINK